MATLELVMDVSDHTTIFNSVNYLLQQHCVSDALFLAEMLHSEKKTSDSAYTLAVCLYRLGRLKQAQYLLSNYLSDSQCVLLYARCCLELKEYQDGLLRLRGLLCIAESNENFIVDKFNNEAGVAFLLLGDLNRKLHLTEEACEAYKQALNYNPFLWSAFESLCQLQRGVIATDVFDSNQVPSFLQQRQHYKQPDIQVLVPDRPLDNLSGKPAIQVTTPSDAGGYVTPELYDNSALGKAIASSTPALQCLATTLHFDSEKVPAGQVSPRALNFTPSTNQPTSDYCMSLSHNTPHTKLATKQASSQEIEADAHLLPVANTTESPVDVNYELPTLQEIPSHQVRRSARLCGIGKSPSSLAFSRHRPEIIPSPLTVARTKSRAKAPTGKIQNPSVIGKKRAISTNLTRNVLKRSHISSYGVDENKPQSEEVKEDDEKMEDNIMPEEVAPFSCKKVLLLLQSLGSAYSCLVNYKAQEAINLFQQLPLSHRSSPRVLIYLGQAMMLKENFIKAAQYFSDARCQNPHRHEGMDLYGSALWHLQKENELVLLAEEMEESNKICPQTFCVLSSLMEYYRDHDAAIRYLERAIQLDPCIPYSYTLLGLEYTLVKDYDKALTSFQAATNIDPCHYNAWYGLSHLYFQQEKWVLAEVNIKRALSLNACSSMAYTQLAMIQQKQGHHSTALYTIEKAVKCNSSNYLPKYHRALILESLEQYDESLKQLNELYTFLSKEPSFYKSLSRVLLKLGRPQDSVLHMAWAMDYSHSSSGMIAGVALVKPHSQHFMLLDDIEGISDQDFIPHAEDSILSDN